MVSASGRYVVTYNGEIYNFRELRSLLAQSGHMFRGTSDTEVMLAAIEEWGMDSAISRFNGMFAVAIWDRRQRRLFLARDRLGKKPLYYATFDDRLIFASELRALLLDPSLSREIDSQSLTELLRFGFIPAPASIFQSVKKLMSGRILEFSRDEAGQLSFAERSYWSARELPAHVERFAGSYESAMDGLHALLRDAVKIRLESDVPLGAFLSGGIDSTLVVALMQEQAISPVRTFTIGFQEEEYDEAVHARAVAKALGTDHEDWILAPREALDLVPEIAGVFDEPFADISQLPTLLVARLTRTRVTVALSGDGGDEWFGGYTRYQRFLRLWKWLNLLPGPARQAAAKASSGMARHLPRHVADLVDRRLRHSPDGTLRRRLERAAEILASGGRVELYECLMSHWEEPQRVVRGSSASRQFAEWMPDRANTLGQREWMMLLDAAWYLPDDILVKVDRTTMSVGLEARAPLLDHRVAKFAASLPESYKFDSRGGKRILRDILDGHVSRSLTDRPKQGFSPPIGQWLRGPLRDWAEALLSVDALGSSGLLTADPVRTRWRDHLAGRIDWSAALWDVLMFQSWHGRHLGTPAGRHA
jgi:asparagine synthase (glutamine-hydrolysing)